MYFFLAMRYICVFEFRKDGSWINAAVTCLGLEPEASSWKELLLVKRCICLFLRYRRKRGRGSQSSLARQAIGLLVKLLIHINVTQLVSIGRWRTKESNLQLLLFQTVQMHIWDLSFHPLENRNIDLLFLRALWVNIKLLSIITLPYFHYFVFVSDHFSKAWWEKLCWL